jgi:xanthine dehydrogenase YagT iron-sulfur-binding subunit
MAKKPFSRRSFLKGAGGLAAGGAIGSAAQSAGGPAAASGPLRLTGEVEVELSINGAPRKLKVEPRTTLLDVLRTKLEPPLCGTKLVCDQGACGACTVLIDGRARYACMTLAVDAVDKEVRTVEGLAPEGLLSPVQQAFWEEDALMCGFCTPGFVMAVTACLEKNPAATEEEVRWACSGNLCRCGTYPHVFAAAAKAGRRMRGEER